MLLFGCNNGYACHFDQQKKTLTCKKVTDGSDRFHNRQWETSFYKEYHFPDYIDTSSVSSVERSIAAKLIPKFGVRSQNAAAYIKVNNIGLVLENIFGECIRTVTNFMNCEVMDETGINCSYTYNWRENGNGKDDCIYHCQYKCNDNIVINLQMRRLDKEFDRSAMHVYCQYNKSLFDGLRGELNFYFDIFRENGISYSVKPRYTKEVIAASFFRYRVERPTNKYSYGYVVNGVEFLIKEKQLEPEEVKQSRSVWSRGVPDIVLVSDKNYYNLTKSNCKDITDYAIYERLGTPRRS